MNFNELNIIKPINKALLDIDYVSATPIQEGDSTRISRI